jgi:hypothetical protein
VSTPVREIRWDGYADGAVRLVPGNPYASSSPTSPSSASSTSSGSGNDDNCFVADCVVVTVPLPMIRDGRLAFSPPLPPAKAAAAKAVGCGPAAKLLLRFRKSPAPLKCHGVICADCVVPEFWFRTLPPDNDHDEETYLATGFCMGSFAEVVCAMGREAAVAAAVAQLDEMFHNRGYDEWSWSSKSPYSPNHASNEGAPETSASANLIAGELHNWASEPFIHLGYTHPVVGAGAAPFSELAKPLPNGRVMFAGEAYTSCGSSSGGSSSNGGGSGDANPGQANMTIHSALDAGVRAAAEAAAFLEDREHRKLQGGGRSRARL